METQHKNIWLVKFKRDLIQNRYNLKKVGLYHGVLKEGIENLLMGLDDYNI